MLIQLNKHFMLVKERINLKLVKKKKYPSVENSPEYHSCRLYQKMRIRVHMTLRL